MQLYSFDMLITSSTYPDKVQLIVGKSVNNIVYSCSDFNDRVVRKSRFRQMNHCDQTFGYSLINQKNEVEKIMPARFSSSGFF